MAVGSNGGGEIGQPMEIREIGWHQMRYNFRPNLLKRLKQSHGGWDSWSIELILIIMAPTTEYAIIYWK
jgi:hypothetical protein